VVSYGTVQKVPPGVDEMGIAGGLAGEPVRLVRCKTVDIEVPANAEIVIEGLINTDFVEPEGPFGESHGYLHPRTVSPFMEVTAITMKRKPVLCSFISQVTPSESSVIKKVGYEPLLRRYLRDTVGIKSVTQVAMHEPLTNLRKLVIVQMSKPAEGDVWRALNSIANYQHGVGKIAIAVDDDIDPHNLDAVWWAICYRSKPHQDVLILPGRVKGHSPPFEDEGHLITAKEMFYQPATDSGMLINAILKEPFPPISLPKREFMEHARELWNRLELPPLNPQAPWYGYSLGQWNDEWEEEAQLAVKSDYLQTGAKLAKRRVKPG
jgi:4-hydroxy-3-polyprenylbenzoate decarboxylase